jgi:hypothetical protein
MPDIRDPDYAAYELSECYHGGGARDHGLIVIILGLDSNELDIQCVNQARS